MHRMQSGGWPYSEVGRDSSKAPSLCVHVYMSALGKLQDKNLIQHSTHGEYKEGLEHIKIRKSLC